MSGSTTGELLDRLLLACLRWRLRRDTSNGFMGAVMFALAARTRGLCSKVDAHKAVECGIAQIALQTMALDQFVKLEAGESARQ